MRVDRARRSWSGPWFRAALLTLALAAGPGAAQVPDGSDIPSLEAFVDGVVEATMRRDRLAGVTLSVVRSGRVILLKGYGLAGVDPERPVDPERSLFRIGSISKTFIWTALMQLQERGSLSLDDPVNEYLPAELQIPAQGFDEPIRIWHLVTHTPGLEDSALGHLFADDPATLLPLHEYLRRFRPQRVRPPGDLATYSNYGSALAGHIVASVAGTDFETYVEENIYRPLSMAHSSFREPLGEDAPDGLPAPLGPQLQENIAQGLAWSEGAWEPQGYTYVTSLAPAGAMSSTASDMARYMLAHLGAGALDGARILSDASARRMRETLFANAEGMNGLSHGFLQYALPGRYASYGHGGATLHFMSNMVMIPELDLGMFVSTNSGTGREFVMSLPVLIVGRLFGREAPAPRPPGDFAERGRKYAGTYLNTRRSYRHLEKLAALGNLTSVTVTDDGYLVTDGTTRWVEVGPHRFQEVGGDRILAFREDASGRITHIFHWLGITAGERIGFFGGPGWLGIVSGLAVLSALGMTCGAWLRRGRHLRERRSERRSSRLMGVLGVLWLGFFALFAAAITRIAASGNDVVFDYPPGLLVAALALLLVAAALTAIAVLTLIPVWRYRSWPVWRRLRHTAAVVVLAALVLTLHHWNVLGFKYF